MTKLDEIIKSISLFNGETLTKKQWEVIIAGTGLPSIPYFWDSFQKFCLSKQRKDLYKLYINLSILEKTVMHYERIIVLSKELLELHRKKEALERKLKNM